MKKPNVSDSELNKMQKQFDQFENQIKEINIDRNNDNRKIECEPQTKLSSKQIEDSKRIYLKPERWIADNQKFNEKFQDDWEFKKEYVQFIAEHKEIQGEAIEIWTHPFGGKGAEFWRVPVNKPVWGPRYLAEQIRKCVYHRMRMDQNIVRETNGMGQMYGQLIVDTIVPRLTAEPVSSNKSIFMGAAA